jgi:hypothetical protein
VPVAVLGWGSLIWQPANQHGELTAAGGAAWDPSGPRLPVEFARISEDGRLTAVVTPEHGTPVPVLWILSGHAEVGDAIVDLARRESDTSIANVHAVTRSGGVLGRPEEAVSGTVHAWLEGHPSLDAAVWTGLGPGPRWEGMGGFSVPNAIAYLESLEGGMRRRSLEYLRRAPRQIDTPVRRAAAYLVEESR